MKDKITILEDSNIIELANDVNKFIGDPDINVVNIKYSTTYYPPYNKMYHSCMIHYTLI